MAPVGVPATTGMDVRFYLLHASDGCVPDHNDIAIGQPYMVQGRVGCERHVDVPQGVRRTVRGETPQPNDIVPDDATIDARIDRSVTTGRIVLPGGVMASIRSRKVHRHHRLTRYVFDQFLPHVPHRRTEHDRDRLVNVLPAGVSITIEEEERQNDRTRSKE